MLHPNPGRHLSLQGYCHCCLSPLSEYMLTSPWYLLQKAARGTFEQWTPEPVSLPLTSFISFLLLLRKKLPWSLISCIVWLLAASSPSFCTTSQHFHYIPVHWHSLNRPGDFLPQGLCTCYPFPGTLPHLLCTMVTLIPGHISASLTCWPQIILFLLRGTCHKLQSYICLCNYLLIIFLRSLSPCRLEFPWSQWSQLLFNTHIPSTWHSAWHRGGLRR